MTNLIAISGKIGSGKDTVGKIIQYLTDVNIATAGEGYSCAEYATNNLYYQDSKWQIKKFANKLKQIVSILTGIPVKDLEKEEVKNSLLGEEWVRYGKADGFYRYLAGSLEGKTVMNNKECTKEEYETELRTNWQTAYRIGYTPRILLQRIGTDLFREQLLGDIWVNALFADYNDRETALVIMDARDEDNPVIHEIGRRKESKWIITDLRFPNELKAVKERGGITIRVNRFVKCRCTNIGDAENCNIFCSEQPMKEHISETALDNANFDITIENNGTIDELVEKVEYHLKQLKII